MIERPLLSSYDGGGSQGFRGARCNKEALDSGPNHASAANPTLGHTLIGSGDLLILVRDTNSDRNERRSRPIGHSPDTPREGSLRDAVPPTKPPYPARMAPRARTRKSRASGPDPARSDPEATATAPSRSSALGERSPQRDRALAECCSVFQHALERSGLARSPRERSGAALEPVASDGACRAGGI